MKYLKLWEDYNPGAPVVKFENDKIINKFNFARGKVEPIKASANELSKAFGPPTAMPRSEGVEDKINMIWELTLFHPASDPDIDEYDKSYVLIYDSKYYDQFDPDRALQWELSFPVPSRAFMTINTVSEYEIKEWIQKQLSK